MNLELHVNLKHAVNINNPCYFPFSEYIQYIKNQTTESTSCTNYITLNHNRYLLQQLIGLESRVFQNILIRAFFFFYSTGQMDCVWRNDSYLYNNVFSSEVLNVMCTEKAIICFQILLVKNILTAQTQTLFFFEIYSFRCRLHV